MRNWLTSTPGLLSLRGVARGTRGGWAGGLRRSRPDRWRKVCYFRTPSSSSRDVGESAATHAVTPSHRCYRFFLLFIHPPLAICYFFYFLSLLLLFLFLLPLLSMSLGTLYRNFSFSHLFLLLLHHFFFFFFFFCRRVGRAKTEILISSFQKGT